MSAEHKLDADAFMRKYLKQPSDATARLVFADWLEETGEPHNAAWAHFIRLKIEADRHPLHGPTRHEIDRHAGQYAVYIRARLTVPAKLFVGYPKSLLQLLPAENVTVRLANFEVPCGVRDLIPESVARENLILPLDTQEHALLIAAADPHNLDLLQKLQFILARDVVFVCGEPEDIREAVDRTYPHTEVESADVSYEAPLIGLEDHPESSELSGIFFAAFSQEGCIGFEMTMAPSEGRVTYFDANSSIRSEPLTREAFARLLHHLLSLPPEAEYTENGRRCLDLQIPLLSGRPFPATLERQPRGKGSGWFRLRFRW
ncbi:MAG: TIGR02996 domain-containing protein [Planctomycetes bacterium]|nr:TIGR02996 domain-containing protein [Planctomycetota bacterium]